MASVLICSETDLARALSQTLIGRGGIDRFKAKSLDEARLLARVVCPKAILIDRDLPRVAEYVQAMRDEPATHGVSVAILAWGDFQPLEVELLDLGANAVLRLPPDAGWDERMARLLSVPIRQEARLPIQLSLDLACEGEALAVQVVNLSVSGMLLESAVPLALFQEFDFDLRLSGGSRAAGRGRIIREASPTQFGVEFLRLDGDSKEAIRQSVRSLGIGQGFS